MPLLAAVGYLLFFHRLAGRDLWSSHEARAGQNAASILREGCWGLPRLFDGTVELQKPPLYYWLVALIAQGRGGGVDAWAVRLPAALSAIGGSLVVFLLLTIRGRPWAGLFAAIILSTAIHYTWLGRTGRIDMPLALCVATALGCFYHTLAPLAASRSLTRSESGPCRLILHAVGYLAIAAAIMLKGPIGVVLTAAVMLPFVLLRPELRQHPWRTLQRSNLWWGIPMVLLLVLPWYLWADAQTDGRFLQRFFWYDNLERAFGEDERLASHPFWFYLPRFLFDFLPWSPLLLLAGWWFRRQGGDRDARFGLVWLLGMAAVLSLVRFKRGDYLLPAYPGAAIFLGCVLERWYRSSPRPRMLASGFALVVGLTAAGWWINLEHVLPAHEAQREQRTFAAAIRAEVPAPKHVLFFRAESHLLAFHLGYPLCTFLEWENLDVWAGRPGEHWIVMPPECAADWPKHVRRGRLEEVLRTTDLSGGHHERPLVLMRIRNLPDRAVAE